MLAMADPSRIWLSLSIFVFLLSFRNGHSFGISPQDFYPGDLMEVKANKLTSNKTQISLSYYSIPYCRPHQIVNSVQNLGEILRGDRIQNSLYQFEMGHDTRSEIVCLMTLNEKTIKEFKEKIDDGYRANMILDHLPLVVPVTTNDNDSEPIYQLGYLVGYKTKDEKYFINNHLSFIVSYHQNSITHARRIVGFEAEAFSINYYQQCDTYYCPQGIDDKNEIFFTVGVLFEESDIKWESRWDPYLLIDDDQIHWFPILNSLMNVLIVLAGVAAGMSATLYRTISNYNQPGSLEEAHEATGWQLVHTDVFRPPVNSELLCVSVGTGFQIFGMIVLTVIFGSLGFISTSNTGGLMTDVILLWAVLGFDGGFSMARLYKTFQGSEWIKTTLKTASMFPGLVFCILVVLNVVKWSDGSWGPLPLHDMFVFAVLWFAVSLPLVFLGSYIGFKLPEIKAPVITNEIPREIPEQKSSFFLIMMGGIIPFVVVFNVLFPTLTFITSPKFYYIFGLVLVVLIMTSVEVTILLCYIQLCREDYLWWWRSYLTAGSSAFYLFIYATFYYFTKLNITELVPSVLYFGYMLIACLVLFVLTGTIGFWACFILTHLLYSSVKIV